ncbi:type 1 fimbrial protein, partial [Escherichia coli]|nr:type 1 fimbrial protein [Escherichia coli]
MKKQPRFITILIGALLSGVAFQVTAANTINPNSGTSAQGAGGQITFNGSITDSSCNVDSNSSG